jgi:hypothetical protein
MRNLVRTSASAGILLAIMLGGGVLLWVGVPVGWLYIGSQIQGSTNSIGMALAVMFTGTITSVLAVVIGLNWLNRKHVSLREARGLDTSGQTALEAVMTVSALVAFVGFAFWFLVIAGPGPSLAPMN